MDVGFVKSGFPWCNNTLSIWSRLDRVFANSKWLSIFPNIRVEHFPWLKSDHCPLLIKIGLKSAAFRPFKKERFWLEYDSFLEVVSTSWKQPAWGSPLCRFFSKLKRLKGDLKLWINMLWDRFFQRSKKRNFISGLRHSEIIWKQKSRMAKGGR